MADEPLGVYTALIPGRFRWRRWMAFVDNEGHFGPIAISRHREDAKDQAIFLWKHGKTWDKPK